MKGNKKHIQITLLGNPKSNQTIYKYFCRGGVGRFYMTKEGKDIKEYYRLQARQQYKEDPVKGELEMFVDLIFGDKRVRDIDNYLKLVNDSLEGIVYKDDKQIKRIIIEKSYDKENPRTKITIAKYGR